MGASAIRIENLTRDFETVRAVDGLSLEVPAGSIFGFLGPNGSGKTTTIRLLLGLLDPTSGSAQVLGFDSRTEGDAIREQTGALLEHHGLYEQLSAADNLEYYGRIWRMPKAEIRDRAEELLTHLELWDRRDEKLTGWSTGMKQKLALARVLIHRPSLIFLDEPTAGLDVISASTLRKDLASLAENNEVTIFLTTHNMVEAEKLCNQVAVIRKGKLVAMGNPDALRAQTGGMEVEVVARNFSDESILGLAQIPGVKSTTLNHHKLLVNVEGEFRTPVLVKYLVDSGIEIEEVRKGQASLEDVFLTLMEEEC